MKTPLTLSIVLNGLLLAALGVSLAHREKPVSIPVTPAVNSEPAPAPQVVAAQPFRWSQLEATNDYRSYVANLRAVGCPESTIRAIVTADFEAAMSFEKRRLESAGKNASLFSPEATGQIIAGVLDESTSLQRAATTVAITANSSATPIAPAQTGTLQPAAQTIARASYPVVYQSAVQNDSSLTPNQRAAVRQLQQQFADAVGGADQNPNNPAYAARWQTARQNADDALRAQLGTQAYLAYEQQHYYSNFQQVILNAGDNPVTINPEELAR